MPIWPAWWDWELELSPHVLKRMKDRAFTESDLRGMLDAATGHRPSSHPGRHIVTTRHGRQAWEVVVESDDADALLIVITAYARSS